MDDKLPPELMIALTEAKMAIEGMEDKPVEDRLRAAMKVTRNHWMARREEDQFKAAVGAVLLAATEAGNEEEVAAIKASMDRLKMLNAVLDGVPVDYEAIIADNRPTVHILALWREEE